MVTATTEIYTLSLHDALPIWRHPLAHLGLQRQDPRRDRDRAAQGSLQRPRPELGRQDHLLDRKSTRLNSSHSQISYAVFCLKKKKKTTTSFRFNLLFNSFTAL